MITEFPKHLTSLTYVNSSDKIPFWLWHSCKARRNLLPSHWKDVGACWVTLVFLSSRSKESCRVIWSDEPKRNLLYRLTVNMGIILSSFWLFVSLKGPFFRCSDRAANWAAPTSPSCGNIPQNQDHRRVEPVFYVPWTWRWTITEGQKGGIFRNNVLFLSSCPVFPDVVFDGTL